METKEILLKLRTEKGLSQEELAEKVHVTRQAVSRWETGETTPNTETLILLSKLYNVSINTLLGSPNKLIYHYRYTRHPHSTIYSILRSKNHLYFFQ